jgi:hypothetical protein
LGNFKILRK